MRWALGELLDLSSLVIIVLSGASRVNMLLREGNRSNCLESREELGLFQEEKPRQMGTIFLVTESKHRMFRKEPYQSRITSVSLLQETKHLLGSAMSLLGKVIGNSHMLWPSSLSSMPTVVSSVFLSPSFPGKPQGMYFLLPRNES